MIETLSKGGRRIAMCVIATGVALSSVQVFAGSQDEQVLQQGKEITFDRKKGNCLACHAVDDGSLPGNIAPPLMAMKQRFPDFEKLKQQISNPLINNPDSMMPPFGLHNILTDDELQKVAQYIHSL